MAFFVIAAVRVVVLLVVAAGLAIAWSIVRREP